MCQNTLCLLSECAVPFGTCHCGCGSGTRKHGQGHRVFVHGHNMPKGGGRLRVLPANTAAPYKRYVNKTRPSRATDPALWRRTIARQSTPDYIVTDRGYDTPCWLWQRGTKNDYGITRVDGRVVRVHRLFWERVHGPVPENLELDHKCKQKLCCRVDHLEPVTHTENVRRGPHTILNPQKVREIRASDLDKETLAKTYNVTTQQIGHVINRTHWKDVD